MYVIKRKRICLILIAVLLGIFVYSYEKSKIKIDDSIQPTTATPVSGKVIVVDGGHRSSGRTEHKVVLGQQKRKQI